MDRNGSKITFPWVDSFSILFCPYTKKSTYKLHCSAESFSPLRTRFQEFQCHNRTIMIHSWIPTVLFFKPINFGSLKKEDVICSFYFKVHTYCQWHHRQLSAYRTRAIITRSWFETTLDYKPWILGPTFLVYVLK